MADAPRARKLAKRIAKRQETTTYSDIAPLANLDMADPANRDEISQLLGQISTYEHQQGQPMLTAIVIHREDNIPGPGFFELARHLGRLKEGNDKLAFFCHEVARVHQTWSKHS